MAINLKPEHEYTKVELINIVSLQGDDYTTMCQELDSSYDPMGSITAWLDKDDIINYLLQWYEDDDSKYMSSEYRAIDINTPFLGKLIKIKGYKGYFLYSHNPSIGYAGLSKITRIIR